MVRRQLLSVLHATAKENRQGRRIVITVTSPPNEQFDGAVIWDGKCYTMYNN